MIMKHICVPYEKKITCTHVLDIAKYTHQIFSIFKTFIYFGNQLL